MSETACACGNLDFTCLWGSVAEQQPTTTSCTICPPPQSPLFPPGCGDKIDDDECGCGE